MQMHIIFLIEIVAISNIDGGSQSGFLMGFPTFQALDMSPFHSSDGLNHLLAPKARFTKTLKIYYTFWLPSSAEMPGTKDMFAFFLVIQVKSF